ncbi:MAG: RDD family protein [Chloroflexota bacterium]|nr:RDD family protein [Chloroflexota bacterium]
MYADVPNRAIAYIIDAIILFVINIIVSIVIGAILGPATKVSFNSSATDLGNLVTADVNYATVLVTALVSTAVNGIYFVWTWTNMRGSLGQKLLSMQVGNEGDGKTLTMNQAITRWIFLGAPFGIAGALNPIPALGVIIALAALAWFIALLVTTAQSPTKQGLHDRYAHTMVVKAARTVA